MSQRYLYLHGFQSGPQSLKARETAAWLQQHPAVATVFCPALPTHPGHALWLRDCQGTNGLVSLELQPGTAEAAVDLMRQRGDAPKTTMDFLFTQIILHLREQGVARFNLGMVPLSGMASHRLAPRWQRQRWCCAPEPFWAVSYFGAKSGSKVAG